MRPATLKRLASGALHAVRADRLIGRATGRGAEPLVLCYHRVVDDVRGHPGSAPAMLVSQRRLEEQLDWIGRERQFVDLPELCATLQSGGSIDRPVAAVTFDDGYADVYWNAVPLLRRKGIPATFFVVTGLVGTSGLHVHDELHLVLPKASARLGSRRLRDVLAAHGVGAPPLAVRPAPSELSGLVESVLRRLPLAGVRALLTELATMLSLKLAAPHELASMSFAMLRRAADAGFTIGSHTRSHRLLPNEDRHAVLTELADSKRVLEERLRREVPFLAYPDGQYDGFVLEAAARVGYRYGFTTCGHGSAAHPLLAIPRRTLWERSSVTADGRFSPAMCSCLVAGVFDLLRPCRFDHQRRHAPWPGPGMLRRSA